MATASQRRQLGAFLRARRDQLRPGDFGLAPGQRRRAPGLRREEVALLCGLSPTWIAWIEQGRTTAISVASLAAIARGLRLSRAERRYLFQLAARRDPSPQGAARWNLDELRPLVNAVRGPAYVLDPSWSPLIWNNAAAVLFRGWLHRHDEEPASGLLEYVFLAPDARRFIVGWPARARRLVAEFRADTAASPDDAVRDAQIEDLRAASGDFRRAWDAQEVLAREGGERSFQPERGPRRSFHQFTLRPAAWPQLKLVVLAAAGQDRR